MMPNLAHIHLLLNHWPIIGTFIAVALLLVAILSKSDHLEQVTLALFCLLALASVPAFMSGNLAQQMLEYKKENVSKALIDLHQGSALITFIAIQIVGAVSWLG